MEGCVRSLRDNGPLSRSPLLLRYFPGRAGSKPSAWNVVSRLDWRRWLSVNLSHGTRSVRKRRFAGSLRCSQYGNGRRHTGSLGIGGCRSLDAGVAHVRQLRRRRRPRPLSHLSSVPCRRRFLLRRSSASQPGVWNSDGRIRSRYRAVCDRRRRRRRCLRLASRLLRHSSLVSPLYRVDGTSFGTRGFHVSSVDSTRGAAFETALETNSVRLGLLDRLGNTVRPRRLVRPRCRIFAISSRRNRRFHWRRRRFRKDRVPGGRGPSRASQRARLRLRPDRSVRCHAASPHRSTHRRTLPLRPRRRLHRWSVYRTHHASRQGVQTPRNFRLQGFRARLHRDGARPLGGAHCRRRNTGRDVRLRPRVLRRRDRVVRRIRSRLISQERPSSLL